MILYLSTWIVSQGDIWDLGRDRSTLGSPVDYPHYWTNLINHSMLAFTVVVWQYITYYVEQKIAWYSTVFLLLFDKINVWRLINCEFISVTFMYFESNRLKIKYQNIAEFIIKINSSCFNNFYERIIKKGRLSSFKICTVQKFFHQKIVSNTLMSRCKNHKNASKIIKSPLYNLIGHSKGFDILKFLIKCYY